MILPADVAHCVEHSVAVVASRRRRGGGGPRGTPPRKHKGLTLTHGRSALPPLLLALLAGFMFLSMRKQKKRMAEMQDMQNSVSTGARIQLTSGLYGTVIDATSSDFVDVEIATGW